MSDTTAQSGKPKERAWYEPDAKLSRRHAADRRLRIYGIVGDTVHHTITPSKTNHRDHGGSRRHADNGDA